MNEKRKQLLLVRSSLTQAMEAVKEAKDRLINAGMMPNTVEELTDAHSELHGLYMAVLCAQEACQG